MRGVVLLVVLSGCDLLFTLNEPDLLPEGLRRRTITITPQVAAPVTDFMASVRLDGDADLTAHALDGGIGVTDIRFQTPDRFPLFHEVVAFDKAAGVLEVWVRIPTLARPATVIEMLYGDGVPQMPLPSFVWPTSVAAAWHLGEASGPAFDSTSNTVTLRPQIPPMAATGLVGGAREFFGGGEQLCADPEKDFVIDTNQDFSLSLWVFVKGATGSADRPFAKGGGSASQVGYNFELGDTGWVANVADDDSLVSTGLGPPLEQEWVHLAFSLTRDPTTVHAYYNGAQLAPKDASAIGVITDASRRSCLGDIDQPFLGLIDEVRFYKEAITIDRIGAEIANLQARTDFMTIDPPIVD